MKWLSKGSCPAMSTRDIFVSEISFQTRPGELDGSRVFVTVGFFRQPRISATISAVSNALVKGLVRIISGVTPAFFASRRTERNFCLPAVVKARVASGRPSRRSSATPCRKT